MHLYKPLILAAAAVCHVCSATPIAARSPFAVKDSHFVPAKWTKMMPAPANHKIELRIGLAQGSFDDLERHLYEVSDPGHERYGQHLSGDEVHDLVRPTADTLAAVKEWLADNNIDLSHLTYSKAEDWISVSLPVSKIEALLDAKYHVYGHEDGDMMVRTPEWSLPKHLHQHIDTIQPTNSFFRASPKARGVKSVPGTKRSIADFHPQYISNPSIASVCNTSAVTSLCLRTLYGTVDYKVQAAGKNKVGLNDFLGESNNRSDIHIFLEQYRPEAAPAAYEFKFDVIANGTDYQTLSNALLEDGTDEEGNLDAQTILGIDYPTPLIAYTTGSSPPFVQDEETPTDTNEPYLAWLDYVLGTSDDNLAQTISTSYDDDEQTVPLAYAERVCKSFAQLGARGVSLFFAAGDDGVGASGGCATNNGTGAPTFLPEFPSTCPYITSVGATHEFAPEVVAYDTSNGFASGGGFSNYFPRPKYQSASVPAYVKSLNGEFAPYYNPAGRGYPDISAQGQAFITIWNGSLLLLDGTSASTPTAAAVFALVNDALIAAGRSPMGFINPWLYAGGHEAFTDVTSGSAIGCQG